MAKGNTRISTDLKQDVSSHLEHPSLERTRIEKISHEKQMSNLKLKLLRFKGELHGKGEIGMLKLLLKMCFLTWNPRLNPQLKKDKTHVKDSVEYGSVEPYVKNENNNNGPPRGFSRHKSFSVGPLLAPTIYIHFASS